MRSDLFVMFVCAFVIRDLRVVLPNTSYYSLPTNFVLYWQSSMESHPTMPVTSSDDRI